MIYVSADKKCPEIFEDTTPTPTEETINPDIFSPEPETEPITEIVIEPVTEFVTEPTTQVLSEPITEPLKVVKSEEKLTRKLKFIMVLLYNYFFIFLIKVIMKLNRIIYNILKEYRKSNKKGIIQTFLTATTFQSIIPLSKLTFFFSIRFRFQSGFGYSWHGHGDLRLHLPNSRKLHCQDSG